MAGRRRVARFVAKWRTEYSICALLLYLVVVLPASVLIFPDNNMWLALVVILVGVLDQLKDLADQLEEESDEAGPVAR